MATTPVYIVVRSVRMTSGTPLIRVRSRKFQNPDDDPFFQDPNIVWHMVVNPAYAATENAQLAILTAETDRDSRTDLRIAGNPKFNMAEARRDLRSLVVEEMRVLMGAGNMRLQFVLGTGNADGDGDVAVFDRPLGSEREWIQYAVRTVDAHTE